MSEIKIQPLGNRVVIQAIAAESITKSGIIIPDTASKEKPQQGKIVAIGSGMKEGIKREMEVKVGDTVLFTKYGPHEIKIDGQEYLIADADDLLGIVN